MIERCRWSLTRLVLAASAVAGIAGVGAAAEPAADVRVAPDGDDAHDGAAAPVRSLRRALDRVREIRRAAADRTTPVVVELAAGRHELAAGLVLDAADSGTPAAPTVIRGVAGTRPIVSGGRLVGNWSAVTDDTVLARLPEAARGRVLQADLRALGIADFGTMQGGFLQPGSSGIELFVAGERATLARYPNHGFLTITAVAGETSKEDHGHKGCREGVIRTDDKRVARWAAEPAGMVLGYWFWDWADQRQPIASVDPASLTITLAPPHHGYGYRVGQWFHGYNLLCELDEPGEWVIDRDRGLAFLWPPAPLTAGSVEVSLLPDLVTLRAADHVVIRDLAFEAGRGRGVVVAGGRDVTIGGCLFRNLGGTAVTASGTGHRVVGCDIHDVGQAGIELSGGDRRTLTPGDLAAENNHIHHYGRWVRTYQPGVRLSGVGNRAVRNLIHDAPHMAIGFGGNEHLIEANEIHHVCLETNDAGAIYGGRNWSCRGHVIRHNFLHDLSGLRSKGCVGVYLDDCFSAARIEGNLFRNVTRAVFIGGGRDTIVTGNVFVDCKPALHVDARGLGWGERFHGTLLEQLAAVPYADEPWRSRYPELAGLAEDPLQMAPVGTVIDRNIQWRGTWSEVEPKATPFLTFRHNMLGADPGFVDEGEGDYAFRPDSLAATAGFAPVTRAGIGPTTDEFRRTMPSAAAGPAGRK